MMDTRSNREIYNECNITVRWKWRQRSSLRWVEIGLDGKGYRVRCPVGGQA